MGRKIERNKPVQPAAESDSAVDALASLKPEASLTVAGRKLTVREYVYFEGLEVAHVARAFIEDLIALGKEGQLRFSQARRLFGVHRKTVVSIAARAADVEPEWVEGLGAADADAFMATWFAVNLPFFMREVVTELREDALLRLMASKSIGSSSASPAPDSALSMSSGSASPSGS
jgi:hypothetical protein